MPDDTNDTPADSPKDIATGPVTTPSGLGPETGEAAGGTAPPKPGAGTEPAGQRDSAYGGESEGADHETEEAAAYRENDA